MGAALLAQQAACVCTGACMLFHSLKHHADLPHTERHIHMPTSNDSVLMKTPTVDADLVHMPNTPAFMLRHYLHTHRHTHTHEMDPGCIIVGIVPCSSRLHAAAGHSSVTWETAKPRVAGCRNCFTGLASSHPTPCQSQRVATSAIPKQDGWVQKSLHWTRIFTSKLSSSVKLVGATISCGSVHKDGDITKGTRSNPHVQSYVAVTDQVHAQQAQAPKPSCMLHAMQQVCRANYWDSKRCRLTTQRPLQHELGREFLRRSFLRPRKSGRADYWDAPVEHLWCTCGALVVYLFPEIPSKIHGLT